MGRSIEKLKAKPQELRQLGVALEAAWDALEDRDINLLIITIRRRSEAIIAARGDHTFS